jgi:hypothetical protein
MSRAVPETVPAVMPGCSMATARASRQLDTYTPIPPWMSFIFCRNCMDSDLSRLIWFYRYIFLLRMIRSSDQEIYHKGNKPQRAAGLAVIEVYNPINWHKV